MNIKIDSATLEKLMDAKGLTKTTLAAKAGLTRKTIERLLNPPEGRGKRTRNETIEAIAKALEVPTDQLWAKGRHRSAPTSVSEQVSDRLPPSISQMNIRIDHATRNALYIVSRRYGVEIQQVIKLAPLLFLTVAERSLAQRRTRINALKKSQQEAFDIAKGAPYLSPLVYESPYSDAILEKEEKSIAKNDIFSDDLYHDADEVCSDKFYEDSSRYNPFAIFLRDFVSDSTGLAEVETCGNGSLFTGYKLSPNIFEAFFSSDTDILNALVDGTVGIHEIPSDIKDSSAIGDFIKSKADESRKEIIGKLEIGPIKLEELRSMLENVSVPEKKTINGGEDD